MRPHPGELFANHRFTAHRQLGAAGDSFLDLGRSSAMALSGSSSSRGCPCCLECMDWLLFSPTEPDTESVLEKASLLPVASTRSQIHFGDDRCCARYQNQRLNRGWWIRVALWNHVPGVHIPAQRVSGYVISGRFLTPVCLIFLPCEMGAIIGPVLEVTWEGDFIKIFGTE